MPFFRFSGGTMRFACLSTVAPGDSLAAQCAAIAAAGCAGVETIIFPDTPLAAWQAALRRAAGDAGLELAVVIVGGLALAHSNGLAWAREALHAVAELGTAALITPEYRAQHPLPLLPPYPPPPAAEQARLDAALDELSTLATQHNLLLLCEPLTQFESGFWRDTATVAQACQRLGNPLVRLALDTHNMNVTEANLPSSILQAGALVGHIHLADSNRRVPGQGHIAFGEILAALHAIQFDGWHSFECAVDGDFVTNLRETIARLTLL